MKKVFNDTKELIGQTIVDADLCGNELTIETTDGVIKIYSTYDIDRCGDVSCETSIYNINDFGMFEKHYYGLISDEEYDIHKRKEEIIRQKYEEQRKEEEEKQKRESLERKVKEFNRLKNELGL